MDDLRLNLGLACTMKQKYDNYLEPDFEGYWDLPQCISMDYNSTIFDALEIYFGLIRWKLNSDHMSVHLDETDILEAQWTAFNSMDLHVVPSGSTFVAEQIWYVKRLPSRSTASHEVLKRTDQ